MKRSPLRFVVVTIAAGGVTLGLLWIMQALVGVAYELGDSNPPPVVDFVRLKARRHAGAQEARDAEGYGARAPPPPAPDHTL
jgi:hypothetical protein